MIAIYIAKHTLFLLFKYQSSYPKIGDEQISVLPVKTVFAEKQCLPKNSLEGHPAYKYASRALSISLLPYTLTIL